MIRTFLVAIDMDVVTPEELELTAGDIEDALAPTLNVQSVKPWENPTLQPTTLITPPPTQSNETIL